MMRLNEDLIQMVKRGYIAMLAVDKNYRKRKIGATLVSKAIEVRIPFSGYLISKCRSKIYKCMISFSF